MSQKSYKSIGRISGRLSWWVLFAFVCSHTAFSQVYRTNFSRDLIVGELLGRVDPDDIPGLIQNSYYPVLKMNSDTKLRKVKSSDQEVVFELDYPGQSSAGHPTRIIFRFFISEYSLIAAIIRDEIDFAITDSYHAAEEIHKATAAFQIHFRYKNPNLVKLIAYNNQCHLLRRKNLRKALTHAINRKYIFEKLLKQNANYADGPLPEESKLRISGLDQYKFNPRRALQLFKLENWNDSNGDGVLDKYGQPFRISIIYEKGVMLEEQIATRIKIDWNKIGVDVVREPLVKREIKKKISQRDYDVILMDYEFSETIESFEAFFYSKSKENFLGYRSRSVDHLFELYKIQESSSPQKVMFQAIQKDINQDHPAAFLFFVWLERYFINRNRFTNFRDKNGKLLPFTEWELRK